MAGKVYRTVDEYFDALEAAIPTALTDYAGPLLERILMQYIVTEVYMRYTPKNGGWVNGETYQRRYALLHGVESWVEGTTLVATSSAEPSPSILGDSVYGGRDGEFLTLLASGNMGISGCQFPRPVIPEAQAEVDRNLDVFTSLLVDGLNEIV